MDGVLVTFPPPKKRQDPFFFPEIRDHRKCLLSLHKYLSMTVLCNLSVLQARVIMAGSYFLIGQDAGVLHN